jgi:cytochrome c5
MSSGQSSGIKTPKQLIVVVVLGFLVPILTIILLARFMTGGMKMDMRDPAMSADAIAKRLQPFARVVVEGAAEVDKVAKSGEEVYKATCAACHTTGALNAPKIGDKAAWAPRIKPGLDSLVGNALKGIRQMPPRGGGADLSDLEVARAVVYLANESGSNFKEPAAPAPQKTAEKATDKEPPKTPGKPAEKTPEQPTQAPSEKSAAAPAPAAGAAPAGKVDGQAVYQSVCAACHATGVAQAPKAGDKEAWAPRLKAGTDTLYASVLKGKGAMPPKGGGANLSEAEVKAAVDYLVSTAK